MWIRPSPCEWMPAFCVPGSGCRTGFSNAGTGASHSPQMLTPREVCQWSPGLAGGRRWRHAGGPVPALLAAVRRVKTMSDDADDDDDGDGDVPTDRPAAAALRLAVRGSAWRRAGSGCGTAAWRVAGYPLTLRRLGSRAERTRGDRRSPARTARNTAAGEEQPAPDAVPAASRRTGTPTGGARRSCGTGAGRCSRPGRARRSPPGS